jgi:tetratricopeptide (TPR) repeat protein
MRLAAAFTFFVLVATLSARAGELKGVVYENEVGSGPIPGVAISSLGANPTETDANGQFRLVFPNLKPGDEISVVVKKAGYVVVNEVQVDTVVLSANPSQKLLKIYICKQASREEMTRRYYRLKSVEAIEARYATLLKENLSNALKIAQLRQEHDQAIKAAEQTAEELAKTKPGQSSELYNRAMRFFLDGEIDQALKILNEDRLDSDLAAAQLRKEEAEKAIEQIARSWVLKGRLLTLEFRYAEAEQAYREAVLAGDYSFHVNFAYEYMDIQELIRYINAADFRAMPGNRENHDESNTTVNILESLHRNQTRIKESCQAYEKALKIRRELAQKNPDTYLPDLADTLTALGVLHREQKQIEEARQAFQEALMIYQRFAARNPGQFHSKVTLVERILGELKVSDH